ncbi:flagellar hook-basal body complex protein FliE [Alkaliphilus oremlandii]|uniref:Flagellar hook-basal body complex protein FliE n=1 Tax=Alkaliphilus oremlandii (strain OhILAs) TaxID=350688 RepID=A8MHD5_ALKOO|nr:flagellar hook-basal body complex protein FliE [Alkaliphilus oremlandii]ABW19022.1 flagellar hook-basal body complex subunit FliE [Alkaliphilus oremlandii OhILAs]
MEISNINQLTPIKLNSTSTSKERSDDTISFSSFLNESLNKVVELEKESQDYTMKLVTGEIDNLSDVMIAAEKADIALQLTMQIRNKVLDAYREIMRMQI